MMTTGDLIRLGLVTLLVVGLVFLLWLLPACGAEDPWVKLPRDPWKALPVVHLPETSVPPTEVPGEAFAVLRSEWAKSGDSVTENGIDWQLWRKGNDGAWSLIRDGKLLGWWHQAQGQESRWLPYTGKHDEADAEFVTKNHWKLSPGTCGMLGCAAHGGGWMLAAELERVDRPKPPPEETPSPLPSAKTQYPGDSGAGRAVLSVPGMPQQQCCPTGQCPAGYQRLPGGG